MTEFERQMASRIQALEFLVLAIIRGQLHQMTPAEAAATIAQLELQFSQITVPPDANPDTDMDDVMANHRDAQHLLSRLLHQAAPQNFGEAEQ